MHPQNGGLYEGHQRVVEKGVEFHLTPEHEETMREIVGELPGSNVLYFPDYVGAMSGACPSMLVTDASRDGLSAMVEQRHSDGEALHLTSESGLPPSWTQVRLCGP